MVLLFGLTTFLAAALLFVMQPMMGKMLLPRLGGGPEIWNTTMVFFQIALLAGYAYAHLAPARLGVRRQTLLHPLLMLMAVPTFHLAIPAGQGAVGQESPAVWLLRTLALTAGPAFLLISTSGPLLQRWFTQTGHPKAENPYFLYASSNAGSMLGLLSYPLVIEPNLGLRDQSLAFSWCYAGLVGLTSLCAWAAFKGSARVEQASAAPVQRASKPGLAGNATTSSTTEPPITWGQRGMWVLYAAVPSSLMLGVTHYLSTDIAAMPLMWVIPLAIYLLSFMLVFSSRPIVTVESAAKLMPVVYAAVAVAVMMGARRPIWILFTLHLFGLFLACMLCHGRLVESKPPAKRLTEFYLLMSLGGAIGGTFNGLLAPVIFDSIAEYPIAIALALALRPARESLLGIQWLCAACPMATVLVLWFVRPPLNSPDDWQDYATGWLLGIVAPAAGCAIAAWWRPVGPAIAMGFLLVAAQLADVDGKERLLRERSFFGVVEISRSQEGEPTHFIQHGTTLHGLQLLAPALREKPTSYYHERGTFGEIFRALYSRQRPLRVAVVGLGAGGLACYARAGDQMTFFEIDPNVVRYAEDPRYFTMLADARSRGATVETVVGDGRLMLERQPDAQFDLIITDAFSSDAIPTHLLTFEAFEMLKKKLAPHGLMAVHVSNRHLDLESVVATSGERLGMICVIASDSFETYYRTKAEEVIRKIEPLMQARSEGQPPTEEELRLVRERDTIYAQWREDRDQRRQRSVVAILVPSRDDFVPSPGSVTWREVKPKPSAPRWTDDYSDLLNVLR